MTDADAIYSLIKTGICRYINTPLKCHRDDIERLSLEVAQLIDTKNTNIISWYGIFMRDLRYNESDKYNELKNLIIYVKNHFCYDK